MVIYAANIANPEKASKSRIESGKCKYKHAREVCKAISGMSAEKAVVYLERVLKKEMPIAFRRFNGGPGHHAQGKLVNAPAGICRWPQKATRVVLDLIKNAMANAEFKGLNVAELTVSHVQCNQAPNQRRRTFRAHGRIGPYLRSPAHIEMILTEKSEIVEKPAEKKTMKLSKKGLAIQRLRLGGGI
eukprot:TRINITY_DN506804_c0_g1_i1.p2 TRINITY_DN506804_c0_g1~~TRINITY_DN506804_c0_g1_i1.p2  ORF type:complete len:187 (-),score=9.42 TRINITY_DN506804_c0_g1_i1:89-649(-)